MTTRKKILFMAEAVTLAHVGRPLALAASLDRAQYALHFACADGYDFCFRDADLTRWPLRSIPSQQFLQALAEGKPVYDAATLAAYVEQDLQLLREIRPDLVVGDFRLSLSVSARLAGVPYVALNNAYWSPYVRQPYTVPSLPLTRLLPLPLADALFRLVRPLAFASHTVPLNRVRRQYGLPSLGWDLNRVYTDADYTLYADVPQLFHMRALPPNHAFIGPVLWSPPLPLPAWWQQLPSARPLLYVTLGSSGQGALLPAVLQALADLPVTVVAATAGKVALAGLPANAQVADYLPGEAAARRAALVVCNGGSPTSHQALVAGVPVVGICGNLDQFLNMHGIVAAGAGARLRADRFSAGALQAAVQGLLATPAATRAAQGIASACAQYDASQVFGKLLSKILTTPAGETCSLAGN